MPCWGAPVSSKTRCKEQEQVPREPARTSASGLAVVAASSCETGATAHMLTQHLETLTSKGHRRVQAAADVQDIWLGGVYKKKRLTKG